MDEKKCNCVCNTNVTVQGRITRYVRSVIAVLWFLFQMFGPGIPLVNVSVSFAVVIKIENEAIEGVAEGDRVEEKASDGGLLIELVGSWSPDTDLGGDDPPIKSDTLFLYQDRWDFFRFLPIGKN